MSLPTAKLREHTPLSAFDRDLLRLRLPMDHQQQTARVAIAVGVTVLVVALTVAALAITGLLAWRSAGLTIGATGLVLGLTRWAINAVLARRMEERYRLLQPLGEQGNAEMRACVERHPDLAQVLSIWDLTSEELSMTELEIVRAWSKRFGA